MRFQPGQSGNPNGRPKGGYAEYTQKFLTLRDKAAADLDVAYEMLKQAMANGEQWAHKLFFERLVHFPHKEYQSTAKVKIQGNTAEEVMNSFKAGLEQIDDYTADDLLNGVKTFNAIKLSEAVSEKINEAAKLTDEQIKAVTDLVTDMNKSNDNKEEVKND